MQTIETLLNQARGRTVLVLGDLMLDEWIIGAASRISPEAPVPVVRFTQRRTAPGGAANVVMNLLRLGAQVRVCGVIGDDEAGADLCRELQIAGAESSGLVADATRPTTLKTRIVAQAQQMVRVDRESDEPLSRDIVDTISARLQTLLDGVDALCLSDYDKGLASSGIMQTALQEAKMRGVLVTGGPKPHNLHQFESADFLSLNEKEAGEAASVKIDSDENAARAGKVLQAQSRAKALAMTRGARGVCLFENDVAPQSVPAHAVEVFDVAGAGDTFLAAATLALAAGAEYLQATTVGNLAAAASVRHVGVVAVTPEEVLHVAHEYDHL
jgi:D-beta-D-heptose 7-phosphate kinase/D-beta-D-heptose 1-phosphate adenosyltransferase